MLAAVKPGSHFIDILRIRTFRALSFEKVYLLSGFYFWLCRSPVRYQSN